MRSPSAKVLINRVDIYLGASGPDNEGGPDFTNPPPPTYPQVACTVQPRGSEIIDSQNRLTQINYYTVIFGSVQTLSPRDMMLWIDKLGVTHKLWVDSSVDLAGRGAGFLVPAVERI